MPTTPKGIVYPDQTGHTRIWEHLQTLGTGVDGLLMGNVDIQVFAGSGTFTRPAGAIISKVSLVGAGGGGGGASTTTAGQCSIGAGGAGGGYSEMWLNAATIGSSVSVTIGSGGAGGLAGNNAGGTGGTTSFGAFCSATGGTGGQGMIATTLTINSGGTGGIGSGGHLNLEGKDGSRGRVTNGGGNGFVADCGMGGDCNMGWGADSPAASVGGAGLTGQNYGGGGSGALTNSGSAVAGGAGAPGYCFVMTMMA